MGRVAGKVAFITGAARGQGRSHAVRLAQEGADIIAVDICDQIDTALYDLATPHDLDETVKQVESLDRRIVSRRADVRDLAALESVVAEGIAELGRLDIVCANAGIGAGLGPCWEFDEQQWRDVLDVNLTGVWKTVKAAIPAMIDQGSGGSIILTSSMFGVTGIAGLGNYVASKHGVTGLMRTLAVELAPHSIRCNSLHPAVVNTDLVHNPVFYEFAGVPGATRAEAELAFSSLNALPIAQLEPIDISNAVLWLASDEARYVTGTTQVLDAGATAPFKIPHA
ncbi:MAG TPA: mycofactocin-coupled SDR family oxidoreductase [Pseudonocardia sp.]|jgi:SDR family mycofactocin-dependent oxidoreductase